MPLQKSEPTTWDLENLVDMLHIGFQPSTVGLRVGDSRGWRKWSYQFLGSNFYGEFIMGINSQFHVNSQKIWAFLLGGRIMKLLAACLLIWAGYWGLISRAKRGIVRGGAPFPCAKISSEKSGWRNIPLSFRGPNNHGDRKSRKDPVVPLSCMAIHGF